MKWSNVWKESSEDTIAKWFRNFKENIPLFLLVHRLIIQKLNCTFDVKQVAGDVKMEQFLILSKEKNNASDVSKFERQKEHFQLKIKSGSSNITDDVDFHWIRQLFEEKFMDIHLLV